MRDDVPRASQAIGTPPRQRHYHQEEPPPPTVPSPLHPAGEEVGRQGDLTRSDSYSLSRGGKLVSSRPWSTHNHHQVVVNMHLVDVQKGTQPPPADTCRRTSSGTSSSSGDSDSSDSEDTSEDEYEVRTPARHIDHTHYTLPEEDEEEEEEEEKEEVDEGVEAGEEEEEELDTFKETLHETSCDDGKECDSDGDGDEDDDGDGTLCEGNPSLQGDGHSRSNLPDEGVVNRSMDTDGGESDSDEEDSESESEETESTVRARQVGVGGNSKTPREGELGVEEGLGGVMVEGSTQPATDEDHNDTLSTLSGDLSFDDRDVTSPPKEQHQAASHSPVAVGALPAHGTPASTAIQEPDTLVNESGSPTRRISPTATANLNSISTNPVAARDSKKETLVKESQEPLPQSRRIHPGGVEDGRGAGVEDAGDVESNECESVRAGVFCISGYPRNAPEQPRLDPSHPSHHLASDDLSQTQSPDDDHDGDEPSVTKDLTKDSRMSVECQNNHGYASGSRVEKKGKCKDNHIQTRSFLSSGRLIDNNGSHQGAREPEGAGGGGGGGNTPHHRSGKPVGSCPRGTAHHMQDPLHQGASESHPPHHHYPTQIHQPLHKYHQRPPQRKEKQRTPPPPPKDISPTASSYRSSPSPRQTSSLPKEKSTRANTHADDNKKCSRSIHGDNGYSSLPRNHCPSPSSSSTSSLPSPSSSYSYQLSRASQQQHQQRQKQQQEIDTSLRFGHYPPPSRQKQVQQDAQQLQQQRRKQHLLSEEQRSFQQQIYENLRGDHNTHSSSSSPQEEEDDCMSGQISEGDQEAPGEEEPKAVKESETETETEEVSVAAMEPSEESSGGAEIAEIYPTENGNIDVEEENDDLYDEVVDAIVPNPKRYSGSDLNTGTVQLYPRENGTTSRMYHSDDSASVRRMYQTEGNALRRMYHSLSDYGMYPAYLSGLGLSTIVPIDQGDRVCGGGTGLRSPAHQSLGTTPTPLMPRLLTPGLSGSASRLSGGNEGGVGLGVGGGIGPAYGGGLASTRLGGSYNALVSSAPSSGYGSIVGGGSGGNNAAVVSSSSRHEDSEDLSDVSSGATSEDSARRRRRRSAQPMKGEASVSGNEDFEWVRASPMLTGLLEGHVTRLATPPDHRGHSLRTSLATPPESGEEGSGISAHRHRQYTRPPPVPRPRTLEAGDLIPHRPIRDNLRDARDGLRDRLYSPSRDLTGHRRSRDSSIERSGRDSSCERGSVSSLHQHNHHHHHHLTSRLPQHTCDCPTCWCDEEEGGYDSCDERHHHHRHSYHEGLHHAHLHQLQSHHHGQSGIREASRERRSRGQGSGDSGRSSPCCCRHCHHLGSLSSLSSHDYCANNRLALPCSSKGSSLEDRVNRLEGDKDSLQLQVTVLSEQVEAQTEKIQDMESLLEQKKDLLRKTEEQLQKEVMTRSSLETQRLELFSEISNMKLRQAAYERENAELRDKIRRVDQQADHMKAQSVATSVGRSGSGRSITPAAASTPIHSKLHSPDSPQLNQHQTPPPNARRKIEQFGTIPRQRELDMGGASTAGKAKGVMFGKGLHFLPFRVAGKRSTSAPNLAETEMQMIDDLPEGGEYCPTVDGLTQPTSSPRMNALAGHRSPTTQHKTTGIKKIFTRLRRSSSGHLESDLGDGDFRRGGMRATASARLGWTSPNTAFKEPGEAFTSWSMETVEAWLGALGLSQYCAAVRSWSVPGRHLSQATLQQLDRDIGIRHPLHRKKLQLAISARLNGDQLSTPLARLDHAWVLRWLDDVGLPQYKDAFSEARIDGRVLNCLTYDDLAFLRLTNLLHVTSLKRGIQVLREHNFDPSVLKRRSVPDEDQRGRSPSEVALWTNHRVMEWLRTVDLSEFAPNLRGSGVHGALMVYEVRFTSELLASLLSIPCSKTLLRRHLNTHFKELVGISIVQEKRELEGASGYTPLTTSAKVKMPKKSQFSLKRKKTKSDLDFDDLLCPLDEKPPSGAVQEKEKETNGDGRLC